MHDSRTTFGTTIKTRTRAISLVAALLLCAPALSAQTAPVPTPFSTAKTAFLASAGAPGTGARDNQYASMLYTSMYQALASAHLYQLSFTPAQADLSMTISMQSVITDVSSGSSLNAGFVRLSIYDTRTHALLWNIDEPMGGANVKVMDATAAKIIADLRQLASGNLPGITPSK